MFIIKRLGAGVASIAVVMGLFLGNPQLSIAQEQSEETTLEATESTESTEVKSMADRYGLHYGKLELNRGETGTFSIYSDEKLPEGVTFAGDNPLFNVNPNTGDITLTMPVETPYESGVRTNITITYPDGSSEQIIAVVFLRLYVKVDVLVEGTNEPASGVEVGLFNSQGDQVFRANVDELGTLTLPPYASGSYTFKVTNPGKYFVTDQSEMSISIPDSFPGENRTVTLYVSNQDSNTSDETSKNGESISEETSKTEETSKVNDGSDTKTSESGEKSIENRPDVKPVAVPTKQSSATNGESLPNTGEGSQFMVFLAAFVSVFAGLGLLVRHGKKVS